MRFFRFFAVFTAENDTPGRFRVRFENEQHQRACSSPSVRGWEKRKRFVHEGCFSCEAFR